MEAIVIKTCLMLMTFIQSESESDNVVIFYVNDKNTMIFVITE